MKGLRDANLQPQEEGYLLLPAASSGSEFGCTSHGQSLLAPGPSLIVPGSQRFPDGKGLH